MLANAITKTSDFKLARVCNARAGHISASVGSKVKAW